MSTYYRKLYGFNIEENQPLLLLKNTAQKKLNVGRYYPAELCFLCGLSDQMITDNKLMMNISKNTKLNPEQKVEEIDTILTLLNSTSKKITKEGKVLPSSSEKLNNYGIKILKTTESSFKGYTMKPPVILAGEKGNKFIQKKNILLIKLSFLIEFFKIFCILKILFRSYKKHHEAFQNFRCKRD